MEIKIIKYIQNLSNNIKVQELLVETIGKLLLKQDNFEKYIEKNHNKIIHICDWINSIVENNEQWKTPRVLTIEALNNSADKYFEKKINKIQTIELNETHEKLIADLGDYYVVQMLTPEALDNESKVMQHCIGHGSYDQKLEIQKYKYLSLRDKHNKAHVTIEIRDNEIIQLQGKQNKTPEFKYLNMLINYFKEQKYFIDLIKFNLIENTNDKKIYSIYGMPDNCNISNRLLSLEFYYSDIEKLPNNLTVNGDLRLVNCKNINRLPDNLTVNGVLKLDKCIQLKEIPNNTKINGNLNLCDLKIEKLPDNLVVGGDFSLLNCKKMKKLPNKLTVKGNLQLQKTNIREIPEDIKIQNTLSLLSSKITKLSNNLSCKYLIIEKNQIDLIKDTMDFKFITIFNHNLSQHLYTKEEFFEKFKNKKEFSYMEKLLNTFMAKII